MDLLEKTKGRVVVKPALHWLYATLYKGAAFGYPQAAAEETGYGSELEAAIKGLKGMHRRGITILPRGDCGCAWTTHGTYASDLAHFAKHLDFMPMEYILAATAEAGKLFIQAITQTAFSSMGIFWGISPFCRTTRGWTSLWLMEGCTRVASFRFIVIYRLLERVKGRLTLSPSSCS
ncbi:unnamed protein product [Tuber melanosporum]|uniref:(Perigord truffle) hypothetical protein n=1 Tax=Tuber melanosporum (strain Mel28) TaxID=656061 RepID=D5GET7_TUBMM|nr:uncharacterized protein GSTUM_00001380001 [Tuber melanosporum]CAZ83030.1 unnamed protein product [Tuber melanosporum]